MVCLSFGGLSQRRNRHRELLNAEGYVSAIVDDHLGQALCLSIYLWTQASERPRKYEIFMKTEQTFAE